jgi:hypothetical protein
MKFIKILQKHRQANIEKIKDFINKNMTKEMIQGIEYDDPKTIKRALKLFNIDYDITTKESQDLNEATTNEQKQ